MTALRAPDRESPVSVRGTAVLAGLAASSGASILLRQTEYGPGLNWDSVAYICIARNLLAGEGYAGCGGLGAMEYWPPLYPMLLAAASLPGFDPHDVAGPFNATILGALVFAAGRWLRRNLASRPLAAAGCFAVAVSVPLAWISSYAMSEPAFLLFSMLALIWADKRLEDGRAASLAWAAAFTALAWATRYAGVAVVALALLLERRSTPDRKARNIWFYTAIAAAPVCVWMARNLVAFERLDFDFEPNGIRDEGACLAFAMLPEYDIARAATGQFDDDGELWRAEFSPPRSGPE